MKKFNNYFNLGCEGHENFNFVNVNLSSDTKHFIVPLLIERAKDIWSLNANAILQSYIDRLFIAFRDKTDERRTILAHAKEQNATKLSNKFANFVAILLCFAKYS